MTEGDYWTGVKDGLYLALAEARLESSRGQILSRLNELMDLVEKGQFQRLKQLLELLPRASSS